MARCFECRGEIDPNDLNVATDRAYCRNCRRDYRYSELASSYWPVDDFDAESPSRHLRVVDDGFQQTLIYRRVSPALLFFIPFTAAWSGLSMYGIYGKHLLAGEAVPPDELLFGLPFLIGTIALLTAIVYMLFGKVVIRLNGPDSWAFTGVGPIGLRKRFDADQVEAVRMADSQVRLNNEPMVSIELQFRERGAVRIGSMMSVDAKAYAAQYLAQHLLVELSR